MQQFGLLSGQMKHHSIMVRRPATVYAFATSEDAAGSAVFRAASDVAAIMDAAAQAIVATSAVRILVRNVHRSSGEDAHVQRRLANNGQPRKAMAKANARAWVPSRWQ